MDTKIFFMSRRFKWAISIVGGMAVALIIFQIGVFVGFHKAGFSYKYGENYHKLFGGPRGGFMGEMEGEDFVNGHAVAGSIAKIDASTIIIKSQDGVEQTIVIGKDSTIRKGRRDIKIIDLKNDDQIVVIGAPQSDGSIEAKILRVFDARDMMSPRPPMMPSFFE